MTFRKRGPIPIAGHVDVYDHRALYVDAEGNTVPETSTLEVKDWKTTASFDYAKTERELGDNIQMTTYAEAGLRAWPQYERARLTHVYFRTRGTPEAKLVTNRKSCDAYRGCPHRGRCSAYRSNSLDELYGKLAKDFKENTEMGLLSNNPQILTQPLAPAPAAQPDVRAQLAAEETALKAQSAAQQQQMPQAPLNSAQLADVCQRLNAYGFGFPSLSGNAAQAFAVVNGQQVPPGYTYQGIFAPAGSRRSLHTIVLNEVGHIFQLEGELAAERAQQPATMQAPPVQSPVQTHVTPPGAPESMPQLAMQHAPLTQHPMAPLPGITFAGEPRYTAPVAAIGATQDAPAKRGRPKKTQDAAPEAVAASAAPTPAPASVGAPATQAPPVATSATVTPTATTAGCIVLINARFVSQPTRSLAGYVDHINSKLAKMYSVTEDGKPGFQDVRCVPKTSPLAFGGWRGAVREVVKAEPPPDDTYHLDTFADELNEVVADALRVVAEERGWLYVRSVRG